VNRRGLIRGTWEFRGSQKTTGSLKVFRSAIKGKTETSVTNVDVYPTVSAEGESGKCIVVRNDAESTVVPV
jgi:hypothetical protein